ncbi:hypothetical protein [Marinagarivorans algicola]|uniref:hypothetical protein n=1 Tax=Marinagarivorans algicola TaxID=1513270 RepID=UPI0009EC9425|nr:hypothetical protein [Marinagarivorans algicola]
MTVVSKFNPACPLATDLKSLTHNADLTLTIFSKRYTEQRDAMVLLRQLHHLSKAVQRHRGMSMALLAGNRAFEEDFALLQCEVERRLAALEAFAAMAGSLSDRDRQNVHNAWYTISAHWQDDDVIDNFELHSHFIEQMQGMSIALAQKIERPITRVMAPNRVASANKPIVAMRSVELLPFIVRRIPEMVEQLARMRGLATYAAAKGECEYRLDRKLRFAVQCVRAQHEALRVYAQRICGGLETELPSVNLMKTYELKLMFLLNKVEADVLGGNRIMSESAQLFALATEIIDVYLNVAQEGLSLVAKWHDEDLEAWLA